MRCGRRARTARWWRPVLRPTTLAWMLTHDPALADLLGRLDDGLRALYGGRYHGLLLFGSHARGDADEGSDVDVLVLLEGPVDPFREIIRSEPVHWPLALEYDVALAIVPVDRERFARGAEAFLVNAAREGRSLA